MEQGVRVDEESKVMDIHERERLARLEERVSNVIVNQNQASDSMDAMQDKLDEIHLSVSNNKAAKASWWKLATLCAGFSSATSTVVVAIFVAFF